MRTLYVRITAITMGIIILSSLIAFVLSNLYFHFYLKTENDEKLTEIAQNTVAIYEQSNNSDLAQYLSTLTPLGYQFYLIDENGEGQSFGNPFRVEELAPEYVEQVQSGNVYHGIANYPWRLMITGFFSNELENTVGVPIEVDGETQALFVRPDTAQQFGEMRTFLAFLLVAVLVLTFLFVAISTIFIVKPIKQLNAATKKIAEGNYHVKLHVNRRDEIGRLATDFSKMSRGLEQVEEKRQEFVSNVSHEIQSPLTSIQGFSKAIREEDLPPETRNHYLSIIENESKRLSALGRQLLTLSFLDSDVDYKDWQAFDIAQQLNEVIATTEWQWQEKDLSLEPDIHAAMVVGDRELLQQVWVNLVSNAIDYTNPGGTIAIRVEKKKDEVIVTVADSGIGIAKADLEQIFERFYKADKARTRTQKSTGLGLSITKKIIELHNGTITVDSEPGKGSSFHVTLPRTRGEERSQRE